MTTIILKGHGARLTLTLPSPVIGCRQVGLKNFGTFLNIPNINNAIKIGEKMYHLEGWFDLTSIARYLTLPSFKLTGTSLGKSQIDLGEIVVTFDVESSLGATLGFGRRTLKGPGRFVGEDKVNLHLVDQFLFHSNISEPIHVNDTMQNVVYNVPVNSDPGCRFSREISDVSYKRLNRDVISTVEIWITDGAGRTIDLRSDLSVTLELK